LLLVATPAGAQVGPDVPPEIPASFYKARRDRLAQRLGGCVGVLKAFAPTGGYDRFDPYFFYLTGIEEPGTMLVLAPREAIVKSSIDLTPRDPETEIWEGYREPMSSSLRKKYQVDRVGRVRGGVPNLLYGALRRSRCLAELRSAFADKPALPADQLGKLLTAFSARTEQKWQDLERLRTLKDEAELLRMEKAIAITIEGHRAATIELKAGTTERKVASRIDDTFFAFGATSLAFPSIVGAGPNGAVLHWEKRDRVIQEGDLVVVDIGSAYGGYASDVTRTYPVSGTFSPEQRKVYDTVLAIQDQVIAAVRPGITMDRLNQIAEEALNAAGYEASHYFGHFVGLQVHDVGDTGAPLEAGMVLTVEPGIYLKDQFGVRIEDMVLVTPRGSKLMTQALPRKAAEIEAWMARNRAGRP
jgi:Xaa-Pro aminopeptidase